MLFLLLFNKLTGKFQKVIIKWEKTEVPLIHLNIKILNLVDNEELP